MRDSLNGDLKPEWVETWIHIHLGKVYDILGQRQRAKAEYQKAINSGNDYNGALAEAEKYLLQPYTKPSGVIG
jgi:tetratricopeptide (TPR) repeat protein